MKRTFLCALILGCIAAVALTAEVTDEEQSDIDVLVTASRVEEPVENVPAYVSVITSDQLSASGQTTLVDALDGLAGIHFRSTSGNAALAEISMRGFGENSHGRVLVLVDGRRLNRPDLASINWLEIPVENVERVEVVRGGASALYGDNAVAGVINIITKSGAPGFDVAASAEYGSFNQNQEGVEVSGGSGAVRYSITGEHTATDGYRDRSAFYSLGFGGNFGLDLEHLSGGLALSYDRLFYELPGALTKAQFDADPTQAQPGHGADEALGNYLNADLSLAFSPTDKWLLDGNAGYRVRFIRSDIPSFPSFTDLALQSAVVSPKATISLPLLEGNRLIVGLDGTYDQANVDTYADISRGATTLETLVSKAAVGAYATDDLQLLRFLSASAGLRYEIAQIAAKTLKTSGAPIDEAKIHHALVYDAGLLLTPTPTSRMWARFNTVFRYPFVDEQVSMYGYVTDTFYSDLEPERGYNFELGLEATVVPWLRWAATGYSLYMSDEIAPDPLTYANVNLDKTRHVGVETEVEVSLSKWLDLSGNYAFTLATFREGDYAGKRVPLVSLHQVDGKAALHLPLGLTAGASATYMSEAFAAGDLDNTEAVLPGYFLLGAFLRYHPTYVPGKLAVYVGVENLLDLAYASTGVYNGVQVYYYPGEGRSWKVGASYRY